MVYKYGIYLWYIFMVYKYGTLKIPKIKSVGNYIQCLNFF